MRRRRHYAATPFYFGNGFSSGWGGEQRLLSPPGAQDVCFAPAEAETWPGGRAKGEGGRNGTIQRVGIANTMIFLYFPFLKKMRFWEIGSIKDILEKIVSCKSWYKVRKFKNPVCCSCLMESAAAHRIFDYPPGWTGWLKLQ